MVCPECSREMASDAAFCPYCGCRIATEAATASRGQRQISRAADRLAAGVQADLNPPSEEQLWSDSYSPKALFGPFVAIDLLVIVAIVAVALYWNTAAGWLAVGAACIVLYGGLGLHLAYQRLSLRYRLTTYRFFHERGLLSRVTDRIEVIDIDDVTVRQGIIERMLGVGTILIQSSDRTHPTLRLPGIDNVQQVADLIDNTRRAERQRRGLHIESI